MRRKNKEIIDPQQINKILKAATVCRLAMCDNNMPYVVPLCYGYKSGVFYFHSASEGHKLNLLDANPNVCVEVESEVILKPGDRPCDWGMGFKSVIGFGSATRVTDPEQKRLALDVIMNHYSTGPWTYSERSLAATVIIRVDIHQMTAKKS